MSIRGTASLSLSLFWLVLIPAGALQGQEEKNTPAPDGDLSARVEKLEQLLQAQKPSPFTVGGTIFGYYMYSRDGIEGRDVNRFDLERSYITVRGPLAETWKVQMTADLFRGQDTYRGFGVRMKFAYVDYAPEGFSVKLGLIPGPFNGTEENAWRYRGISAAPSDRYGYAPTADLGASVTCSLPDGLGELAGYIINGKGYTAPEADKFKDLIFRATLSPFSSSGALKGLTIAAYFYKGYDRSEQNTGLQKDRLGCMLAYAGDIASLGCIINGRTEAPSPPAAAISGSVVTLFGEVKSPWEALKPFSFVARWDYIEPNSTIAGDRSTLAIAGIAYRPNGRLTLALDYQALYGERATTLKKTGGGETGYDGRWFLHVITTF